VNSTAPYNYGEPETQGEFNQAVLAQARQQYVPQLQGIAGDVGAEDTANTERNQALGSIYGTYNTQAQDAYNETKQALTDLITQNAGNDQQAQGTLQAALSSANVPSGQMDQMMGITAPPQGSSSAPYMAAALGGDTAGENELSGIAANLIANAGNTVGDAGMEQAQQSNQESLRHQAALEGYSGQKQAILQQIPTDIQTAQTAETTNAQNAATTALQNALAQKEFGLSAQDQSFNENQATQTLALTKQQDAVTNAQNWKKISQSGQQLGQNEQSIQASIDENNAKTIETEAKLTAAQAVNVQKTITAYLLPSKTEYSTVTKTTGTGSTHSTVLNSAAYTARMNPGQLAAQLQSAYGISREQALAAMQGITVPYGTSGETMGQWAAAQLHPTTAPKQVFKSPVPLPLTPTTPK
jgi:hypothetical protein